MEVTERWKELLTPHRFRPASVRPEFDGRNDFEQDYGRLIFSSSIRRLQDKTQVFPLDKSDFIRTRLTHSLEVSSLGRSLGQSVEKFLCKYKDGTQFKGQLSSLLACAGLIHDLGNPPFGHFGEVAIQDFFKNYFERNTHPEWNDHMKSDFECFDGNVQTLRILLRLHLFEDEFSYNLSFPTLASIIKYPRSSQEGNKKKHERGAISDKKFGYFVSEEIKFKEINSQLDLRNERHPVVFLLEAADDIAYSIADIEDGVKFGTLSFDIIRDVFQSNLNTANEDHVELLRQLDDFYNSFKGKDLDTLNLAVQKFRISAQRLMIEGVLDEFTSNHEIILKGEYNKELLLTSKAGPIRKAFEELGRIVFSERLIITRELTGYKVIQGLLDIFVKASLTDNFISEPNSFEGRLFKMVSSNYRYIFANFRDEEMNDEYSKLQLILDHVSGMTDSYALKLYQELTGIKV